jgi:hypothetical protein
MPADSTGLTLGMNGKGWAGGERGVIMGWTMRKNGRGGGGGGYRMEREKEGRKDKERRKES